MHYHFIMAVWGEAFTRLFLRMALPNQLGDGNLGHFIGRRDATYHLLTMAADAPRLDNSPELARLRMIMPVEIGMLDDAGHDDPYARMTAAHERAMKRALAATRERTALVFLSPDTYLSAGALRRVEALAREGARAVMTCSFRLRRADALPALEADPALSSRELMAVAMRSLHPWTRAVSPQAEVMNDFPSHLFWRVGEAGLVGHCFHIHPLLLVPPAAGASLATTIDGDLLRQACPDFSGVRVITDSDELLMVEVSEDDKQVGRDCLTGHRAFYTAWWSTRYADASHHRFFQERLRLHADAADSAAWRAVEAEADAFVARVNFWLRHPLGSLLLSLYCAAYNWRRDWRRRYREWWQSLGLDL